MDICWIVFGFLLHRYGKKQVITFSMVLFILHLTIVLNFAISFQFEKV